MNDKDFLTRIIKQGYITFDTSALSHMFNDDPDIQMEIDDLIKSLSMIKIIVPQQVNIEFNRFDHSTKNEILDDTIKSVLFANIIGNWNLSDYDKYSSIGENRFENKIPPGYKDNGKKSEVFQKYGDYFIWQQIINHMKEVKGDLLFVINDRKSDWYDKNKKMYREELFDEFYNQTNNNINFISMMEFYLICEELFDIKLENLIEELDYGVGISGLIQEYFWSDQFEIASEEIDRYKDDIVEALNCNYDYIDNIEICDVVVVEPIEKKIIDNERIQYNGIFSCEANLELSANFENEDIPLGSVSVIINMGFNCLQELNVEDSEITEIYPEEIISLYVLKSNIEDFEENFEEDFEENFEEDFEEDFEENFEEDFEENFEEDFEENFEENVDFI